MQTIESVRRNLNAHPLVAVAAVIVAAWVALPLAAALIVLAIAALAWWSIERARSPEARVESSLDARRRQTLRVVQTVSATMADETLLTRAVEREAFQIRRWEARATKAVLAGDDAEAACCIERKQAREATRDRILPELEKQRQAVKGMRPQVEAMRQQTVAALRRETVAASNDGDLLAVRARRAEAKRTVVLTASGLETQAGEQAFQRAVDDVARAEAEADALAELVGTDATDEHAADWEKRERAEAVTAEVEALKQRIGMKRPELAGRG